MSDTIRLILALAGSYLVGSIPTAYVVVKWLKGVDVRTIGSGNVGATNVTRIAGFSVGLGVFLVDLAKGLAVVSLLAPWLVDAAARPVRLGCGLLAVLGHAFPVFLKFRGGKGVATTIGVLLGTMPGVAGACVAVWVVCVLIWRYVSVGSLAAAVTLPIAQIAARHAPYDLLFGAVLAAFIVERHRGNLARLLRGEEHRVGERAAKPS